MYSSLHYRYVYGCRSSDMVYMQLYAEPLMPRLLTLLRSMQWLQVSKLF
jgi:hypothetical protein